MRNNFKFLLAQALGKPQRRFDTYACFSTPRIGMTST
jgi:hypothetical protein